MTSSCFEEKFGDLNKDTDFYGAGLPSEFVRCEAECLMANC